MRIVYRAKAGAAIDFSAGLVRATGIKGICPESEIVIRDGSVGGTVISERSGVRNIVVNTVICGDFERSHRFITEVLGISGGGRLEIHSLDSILSIECYVKSVSSSVANGTNVAAIEFVCPNPNFEQENTGYSDTCVQICGNFGVWEFDGWELTEENGVELSSIFTGSSAFVPNDNSFDSGCVITVELQSVFSYVSAVNAKTKEFVGVKGDFVSGDIIVFRCIDGEKGVFLSNVGDTRKYENITHRIIWGSSFFKIPPSGARVLIRTNTDNKFITANIRLRGHI